MRAAAICCVGGCAGEARDGGDAGEDGSSCRRGAGFASGVNHAPYADDEVCEERSEVRCAERSRRCCARRAAEDMAWSAVCGEDEQGGLRTTANKIAHTAVGCGAWAGWRARVGGPSGCGDATPRATAAGLARDGLEGAPSGL